MVDVGGEIVVTETNKKQDRGIPELITETESITPVPTTESSTSTELPRMGQQSSEEIPTS